MKASVIKFDDSSYVVYQATVTSKRGTAFLSCDTKEELLTILKCILPKSKPVHILLDVLDYMWLIRELKKKYKVIITKQRKEA